MRYTVFRWFIVCILLVSIVGCDGTSNKMRLRKRNQITEVLIKAINDNRPENIYRLYANEVKKSEPTLQLQIKELCAFFDGEIVSFKYTGGRESDGFYEEEHYRQKILASYTLTTESGKEYVFSFKAHTKGIDSESTGLYSLAAISQEDYKVDSLKECFLLLNGVVIVDEQREMELRERISR